MPATLKRVLIKLLLMLLEHGQLLPRRNPTEFKSWAFDSFDNKGFKSYIDERKQKLFASMASGVSQRDYHRLVGQLYELGILYVTTQEIFAKTMQTRKEQVAKEQPQQKRKVKIR